jgi:uncharacterized membrane-anchored protein YhcB (DUF1043 family)
MLLTIANIVGIIVGAVVGITIFMSIYSTIIVALKIDKVNREIKNVNSALDKYVDELKL